jgi:putative heme-binding domain-containing protein
MRTLWLFAISLWLSTLSAAIFAQHATGSDLFSGEQYFQNYCANCHGAAGNLIAGVDLGHGAFRQPYTDDDLMSIVMKGIPGKAMPATPNMSQAQAVEVVKYLRSRAVHNEGAPNAGDVVKGKALFTGKGECLSCHRVAGEGARLGPELTRIGVLRTSSHLAESLLEPDKEVQPNNRSYAVLTQQGERSEGRLLNQDAFSVQLLDSREQLRSFMKAELKSYGFVPSPMPSLKNKLNDQELADLVQYLVSLRGADK